jgi:hypothetical protein
MLGLGGEFSLPFLLNKNQYSSIITQVAASIENIKPEKESTNRSHLFRLSTSIGGACTVLSLSMVVISLSITCFSSLHGQVTDSLPSGVILTIGLDAFDLPAYSASIFSISTFPFRQESRA